MNVITPITKNIVRSFLFILGTSNFVQNETPCAHIENHAKLLEFNALLQSFKKQGLSPFDAVNSGLASKLRNTG